MTAEPRLLETPRPGYWLVKWGRDCPPVPARIWMTDCPPGEPGNKLDRWPAFYPRAQVALDEVDPIELWHRRSTPITRAEFVRLVAELRAAGRERPNDPRLSYRKPINRRDLPLPTFREL